VSEQDARLNGRLGGQTAALAPPHVLSARARHAFEARMLAFEQEADPEGKLPPHVRRQRAEARLRLQMTRLSHRALRKRRPAAGSSPATEPLPHHFREGERNPASRHPDATVRAAIELYAERGMTVRRVGELVGADSSTVARWLRGATRRGAVR
jgi:hypothetical protein